MKTNEKKKIMMKKRKKEKTHTHIKCNSAKESNLLDGEMYLQLNKNVTLQHQIAQITLNDRQVGRETSQSHAMKYLQVSKHHQLGSHGDSGLVFPSFPYFVVVIFLWIITHFPSSLECEKHGEVREGGG